MDKQVITVQKFIDNNDNIRIQIARKFSRDDCDPLCEPLWSGMLYDIPAEYRSYEVIGEGWLMEAQINQISIYFEG